MFTFLSNRKIFELYIKLLQKIITIQVDERGAEFYSMLLFKSLTAAHSGIYTCVVTNTAGKANMSAELAIKGNIFFQSYLIDQIQN